jgi:hypothetical protein
MKCNINRNVKLEFYAYVFLEKKPLLLYHQMPIAPSIFYDLCGKIKSKLETHPENVDNTRQSALLNK